MKLINEFREKMPKTLLNEKTEKILEYTIFALSAVYFVALMLFDTHTMGSHDILQKPPHYDLYFDGLLWAIFIVMIPDIFIKYVKSENWKVFLKKNWIDVLFFVMIPLFAGLRILKVLQLLRHLKTAKTAKSFLKVIYGGKKVLGSTVWVFRLIQIINRKRDEHQQDLTNEVLNFDKGDSAKSRDKDMP